MQNTIIEQDIKAIAKQIQAEASVLAGKTVLLSGGAGFIGRYIIGVIIYLNKTVFSRPCTVHIIDNYITGSRYSDDASTHIIWHEHDVRNPLEIEGRIDYIIHAAGLASPKYYKKYPLETIETAIWGAKNLLELARKKKVKSFLFFSSSEVYGDPDPAYIPTPETYVGSVSPIGPRACYDESKRLGETLCMVYWEKHKVPVKIVRPFNVFGPGMKNTDYRVIPTFLTHALKGYFLPVHDHGNQTRTFCYISDAITGFLKVLLSAQNGQVYNVGNSDNEINMMSLAQTVVQITNNSLEIRRIAYPASYPQDEPQRRCPDLTKIKKQLGYTPKIDLKSGLRRTLRWFKKEYGA